jgi:hypothetical protein
VGNVVCVYVTYYLAYEVVRGAWAAQVSGYVFFHATSLYGVSHGRVIVDMLGFSAICFVDGAQSGI